MAASNKDVLDLEQEISGYRDSLFVIKKELKLIEENYLSAFSLNAEEMLQLEEDFSKIKEFVENALIGI